jgi:hypothetical protein
MRQERSGWLWVGVVIAIALGFRVVPLYWSSLPSTLDGFAYAAAGETAVQTGSFPLDERADRLVFASLLGRIGMITGEGVLSVTQPVGSLIGTASVIYGIVIARRVATECSLISTDPTRAGLIAGGMLAAEGLFLRRTSVPDEEILGILLTLTVAFSLHYAYRSGAPRWYIISIGILSIFPLLHTFTSFVVGLVVTAVTVRHIAHSPSLQSITIGSGMAVGFWLHVATYYRVAESALPLTVPYVDRVTAYPGLFIAWVLLLIIGTVWIGQTTTRLRQFVYSSIIIGLLSVLVINTVTPVFPGTVTTPPIVAIFVLLIGGVSLIAVGTLDILSQYDGVAILGALFVAPAAIIGFSLTASLTPEYFATAMRAQTFLHLPVLIIVAIGLTRVLQWNPRGAAAMCVAIVILLTALSAPLAYLNMDTGSNPSTTLESEYQAVQFSSTQLPVSWAGDHSLTRVGGHQFSDGKIGPVARWLNDEASPQCVVVSQRSWTTTGAHLFPQAPGTVAQNRYRQWLFQRNVLYSNSGIDPVRVSTATVDFTTC